MAAFVSLAAHAGVLLLFVDTTATQGIHGAGEPVSVSIGGSPFDSRESSVASIASQAAPVDSSEIETVPPIDRSEIAAVSPSAAPAIEAAIRAPAEQAVRVDPAPSAEAASNAEPAQAQEAEPVQEEVVALPEEMAFVPDARPDPEALRRQDAQRQAERRQQERAARDQAAQRQTEQAPPSSSAAPAAQPSRSGGQPSQANQGGAQASAEEQNRYARSLLAHVERHKRYPEAARRQRQIGAAQLSITIDRSGALVGASLVASSGHALLDEEALAVARRAAPYPAPPQGVGGNNFSFAVTLRFAR